MQRKILLAIGFFLLGITGIVISQQVGPFVKYEGNPILEPQGTGFEQKAVFNPAAIVQNDTVYLLYRAEDTTGAGQWSGTSTIGLAWSTDGVNFKRRAEPIIVPDHDYELPGGCEDARIVKFGDTYYLTYTAYEYGGRGALLCMATSTDLINWDKKGPIFPDWGWSKSGAIVPEKINDKYVMYFRDGQMWIAYSDDLTSWDADTTPVMRPRSGYFDANLVEPGPPPLITDDGILLFYNGARWKSEGISRAWDVDLSSDGNYAYVPGRGTNNAKVWVINISDPANLSIANTVDIPTPAGKEAEAWAVQVMGNLLYVAAYQAGFWIYDITDPVNPTVLGSLIDDSTESRGLHVVGNYAYIADAWYGLSIIDISDPTNPVKVSQYNTDHDFGQGRAEFHDVRVIDDTAYCAAGNYGLVIVDVSDPRKPSGISFCCDCVTQPRYPTGTYDWGRGLEVVENYAYLGDNRTGLRIIDVSNPVTPGEVGYYSLASQDAGEVWYPTIVGNRAYIGYQRAGFIILDIRDPTNPVSLGSYPMSGALILASTVVDSIAYVVEASSFHTLDISNPAEINQIGTLLGGEFVEYTPGWVLFSKDNPDSILARSAEPILEVTEDWERWGQVPYVVFSEGLVNYKDTWYLYYGGADTRIGVAICEGPIYIGVGEHTQHEFQAYSLNQNYPNPFYASTNIELSLKECRKVSLKIFDLAGREVASLVDGQMESGVHRVIWKPIGLPAGIYFCVLSVNGLKQTRKLVLLE